MVVELAILGCEHRALHVEGYVGQRNAATGRITESADLRRAVGVVDDSGLRARDLIGVGDGREEDRGSKRPEPEQADDEQGEEGAPDPAAFATRLLGLRA